MIDKCKSFILMLDISGAAPQLFIFKNKRYKSYFSSFTSIILLLFSLFFTIYSIREYFKYDSPFIVYSKMNDEETKRTIFMNDTPLMFQPVNDNTDKVSDSVAFFEADYISIFDDGNYSYGTLTIEKCEFGKNIDLKYQEFFSQKNKFGRKIEDFYCFSNIGNISLFFIPEHGMNYINLHMLYKKNDEYTPEQLHSLIVSESDLILHNNKENPISKYYIYQTISGFNSKEYLSACYNFQFVKYETDDGLFYPNNNILTGMTFSDMTYYRAHQYDQFYEKLEATNEVRIGTISFSVNRANFDHYKRSYQRIPSLLADVMSVISLLFEIGRQLSNIFCNKKMSTDLISYLLPKKKRFINKEL